MEPTAQRFVLKAVLLKTRILENSSRNTVKILKLGTTYGHSVEFGISYAFWPLEVSIRTSLKDTKQLGFVRSGDEPSLEERVSFWEFDALLHPNQPGEEFLKMVECDKRKFRGRDKLTIEVTHDDLKEQLTLGVKIG